MTSTEPIDPAHPGSEGAHDSATELELWARCGDCAGWFLLPSDTLEAMASTRCPECDGSVVAFEECYGKVRFPIEIG